MPELPDVEGFRRYLARHAEGQPIVRIEAPDRQLIRNRTPSAFGRALTDHPFDHPQRHGKWVIAPVGESEVLLHFGMTGFLNWSTGAADRTPYDRVIFVCAGGELRYNNVRRFGGIWLARDELERVQVTGPLGPDAATLDADAFDEILSARRGSAKAALMDQHLIAGVGNLLSDEILWRARVHPATSVSTLGTRQRRRLYEVFHSTIRETLRYGRIPRSERWLTGVRDARGARCPRCGTPLRRTTIAGRTSCWCPRDQRRARWRR